MTQPMNLIRNRYRATSFRGRLLFLLVAVSLVQGSVAAYTFFSLSSEPARERVEAQLNASVRGARPVIDAELRRANADLARRIADSALLDAAQRADWTTVDSILGMEQSRSVSADMDVLGAPVDGEAPDVEGQPLSAYVTDAEGEVVAGTRPEAPLLEQVGVTTSQILQGSELVGTLHVPVVADEAFLRERIKPYIVDGIDVFVADGDRIATTGGAMLDRPQGMRQAGLGELRYGDRSRLALTSRLLDGEATLGASMPSSVVARQQEAGRSGLWGFIGVLVLLMIGVAWGVSRAVGDALRRFAQIARQLADGELHRRIPVVGGDEVATLASSFNVMAENLEERIASLVEARAKLRRQVDLFGEALANATEVEEMLQAVCGLAMESTDATHARFWVLDEDGRYDHAACLGLRPGDAEPCGLEKAVAVRNAPVRSDGSPWWVVVPARSQDQRIIGLLTIVSTRQEFSDDDVRIAERIAVQAAVAIDNARMHEQLRLQATRDGLTGLPNHRSLQDELQRRMGEARERGLPLGATLLDIDNFKRINDTYGHPVGDEAIKALAQVLRQGIGSMGMAARYGGEEFVVLMPGCDAEASVRIADRLREDIHGIEVPLPDGGVLRFTASFGVANLDQQGGREVDNAGMLHQADVGLYNAKRSGKDRVSLAGPETTVIEMSAVEKAKLAARERGEDLAPAPEAASDPLDLAA